MNGAIDIVSIVPTYINIASSSSDVSLSYVRVLRLLRVFRLMRSNYQKKQVELLTKTLKQSKDAVGILLFYLILAIILFGATLFAIEEGEFVVNQEFPLGAYVRPNGLGGYVESPFNNIPTAMYFIIITMTTVGYGK